MFSVPISVWPVTVIQTVLEVCLDNDYHKYKTNLTHHTCFSTKDSIGQQDFAFWLVILSFILSRTKLISPTCYIKFCNLTVWTLDQVSGTWQSKLRLVYNGPGTVSTVGSPTMRYLVKGLTNWILSKFTPSN